MNRLTRFSPALAVLATLVACGESITDPGAPPPNAARGGKPEPAPEIVFASDRDGQSFDLYLMNADGSGQSQLTGTPGYDESRPEWSPDRTRIAYLRTSTQNGVTLSELCVLTVGSPLVPPACNEYGSSYISDLAWTSSGNGLISAANGKVYLTIFNWGTMAVLDQHNLQVEGTAVDVSRDGRLAVIKGHQLLVGPEAGGTFVPEVALTNQWSGFLSVAWAPDNTALAYSATTGTSTAVFVNSLVAPGIVQVTPLDEWVHYSRPTWSPDGRKLVVTRSGAGTADLYRVALKGKALSRLTTAAAGGHNWDGNWYE